MIKRASRQPSDEEYFGKLDQSILCDCAHCSRPQAVTTMIIHGVVVDLIYLLSSVEAARVISGAFLGAFRSSRLFSHCHAPIAVERASLVRINNPKWIFATIGQVVPNEWNSADHILSCPGKEIIYLIKKAAAVYRIRVTR